MLPQARLDVPARALLKTLTYRLTRRCPPLPNYLSFHYGRSPVIRRVLQTSCVLQTQRVPRTHRVLWTRRVRCIFLALALLAVALLVALPSPVQAAGYVVNSLDDNTTDDGSCTLREAINAANNTGGSNTNCGPLSDGDDTIAFGVTGIIRLESSLPSIVSAATAGTLTIDGGNSITMSGDTDDDGDGDVRVLVVNANGHLTLQNLTVEKGHPDVSNGGGLVNNGTVSIVNSTFSNNSVTAGWGGGLYNDSGTVTIVNSSFSGNSAITGWGGGLYNDDGTVTITNSTFSGNSAGYSAGAVYSFHGTVTITNSTISGNNAAELGGGLYNVDGAAIVNRSTFSGNSADRGAGIALGYQSSVDITNSTFSGNSASGGSNRVGGALYANNNAVTIINSTFFGNSASNGSGIYNSVRPATVKNTIAANSTSGDNCSGPIGAGSTNNLATDDTCGSSFAEVTAVELLLGPLTGAPAYVPLNTGSAAIDAGASTGCPTDSQNGVTRPTDGDGDELAVCDIGAYEAPTFVPPPVLYLPVISK